LRVPKNRSGFERRRLVLFLSYDADMRPRSFLAMAVATVTITAQSSSAHGQTVVKNKPEVEGGIRWQPERSSDSGMDAAALESIYSTMDQDPHHDLKGIVIVRYERLVSEHYFNGDSVHTLHDIRSATKSITSLLMGIAVQKGLVHSVDDSIALYLPGLPKDGKEKVTIKDLLTMRSGLDAYDDDASSPGNENRLDAATFLHFLRSRVCLINKLIW
jgi:CubicO group peptidase (beta-lactamase class C family)